MTAFWLLARSWITSGLGYLALALKGLYTWFKGLVPAYKLAVLLALSVLANAYQWNHREKVAGARKDGYAAAVAQCAKETKASEVAAETIHVDRQSILDVLLASDKEDNRNRLDELIAKLNTAQEAHAKVKAAKPLPVNCVFDDERVRQANQAIADARHSSLPTH